MLGNRISPELQKALLGGVGAIVAFTVWSSISGLVTDMQRIKIDGEHQSQSVDPVKTVVSTLPIVEATYEQGVTGSAADTISDDLLDAVFKVPVIEKKEDPTALAEAKKESPKESLVNQLRRAYQPVVSALSRDGAFLGGKHWGFGEEIKTMPIRDHSGGIIYPRIVSVGKGFVYLGVGGETLPLPFERY